MEAVGTPPTTAAAFFSKRSVALYQLACNCEGGRLYVYVYQSHPVSLLISILHPIDSITVHGAFGNLSEVVRQLGNMVEQPNQINQTLVHDQMRQPVLQNPSMKL